MFGSTYVEIRGQSARAISFLFSRGSFRIEVREPGLAVALRPVSHLTGSTDIVPFKFVYLVELKHGYLTSVTQVLAF